MAVAKADVVVLAHVLRAEPPDRARRLVARAVELAGTDGVVVVAPPGRPDSGDGRQRQLHDSLPLVLRLAADLVVAAAHGCRG
mgnify:CR=1 FL=1